MGGSTGPEKSRDRARRRREGQSARPEPGGGGERRRGGNKGGGDERDRKARGRTRFCPQAAGHSLQTGVSPCCRVPGSSLPVGSTHQQCPPCWHCLEAKAPPVSQDGTKTLDASIAARRSSSQGDGPERDGRLHLLTRSKLEQTFRSSV